MKLLVVIVNYNGFGLTADCLDAIAPLIDEVPDTHVGLCDNGSAPPTLAGDPSDAERLAAFIDQRGYGDWCSLTAITPNLGFTGGNNAIIRQHFPPKPSDERSESPDPPDYVLLLNNDTLVYPGAFKALVDFMDDPENIKKKIGCAGSRLEDRPVPRAEEPRDEASDQPGNPQVSAFRFFNLLNEFQGATKLGPLYRLFKSNAVGMDIPPHNAPADWVAGASMIIRREVIEQVGALDDGYYTYFDDIDYCHSAKKAGWSTWYVPASRVVHLVGQTTGVTHANTDDAAKQQKAAKPRADYWFQARHRYWLKHHGKLTAALADLALIAGTAICRLRAVFGGDDHGLPARFLRDCIKKSVFVVGFQTPHVVNPATGTPNPTTPNVVEIEEPSNAVA